MNTVKNAKCCGLCEHFYEPMMGNINSVKGECGYTSKEVWSHNICDRLDLKEEAKEAFDIKKL